MERLTTDERRSSSRHHTSVVPGANNLFSDTNEGTATAPHGEKNKLSLLYPS